MIRLHSALQVLDASVGTNIFPQTMQAIGEEAALRTVFRASGVVFSAYQRSACFRSFSRIASAAQAGQYRWRPELTVYAAPQISQVSVLPIGRAGPLRLHLTSAAFRRSWRQSGQYQARGPPGKVFPHWRQVRGLIVVFFWAATQSGQALEPGSPS